MNQMKRLLAVLLALAFCVGTSSCNRRASSGAKKFYWVQALKGHPVHQLTQLAFKEGCKAQGIECEIIGTDGADATTSVPLAEQAMARGDMAGVAIWAGSPAYNTFIERAGKKGIPVIIPHFPGPESMYPGARGVIACDPEAYAQVAADAIGEKIGGKGTVAITQGNSNPLENRVSAAFAARMKERYPQVTVLQPEIEDFDAAKGVAKATAILQSHPDVVAALSTTGGGPTSWALAQRDAHRNIVAIGMDYTRVNLDLVRDGKIYAVVAQPLWEESQGAVKLLDQCVKGEQIPWWTKMPAPLVTQDKVQPYYDLLNKVEAAAR